MASWILSVHERIHTGKLSKKIRVVVGMLKLQLCTWLCIRSLHAERHPVNMYKYRDDQQGEVTANSNLF